MEGGKGMTELKPCPFCGNSDPLLIENGHWPIEIHCRNWNCMAMVVDEVKEDAIRHWNRRVEDEGHM